MACGTPGLVTDVASLPEIVEKDCTGWLIPPNDSGSIRRVLLTVRDQPDLCLRMGTAARKLILSWFTWDKTVEKCLEAYQI